jgi:polyisoprenoid-binding protein YceI
MKSFVTGFLALGAMAFLTPAPARAATTTWDIDSSHSTVQFSVKHMMVSNVKGQFGKVTGTVNLDEKDAAKSNAEIVIDVKTIDTHEPKRDGHLQSPDFFDAAKYPTISFKSTKIEKAGKGKYKMTGDLTMHGVTKSVVLAVEGPTPEIKNPMMNSFSRGATVTGKINRKDWGLTWNKPLEAAGGVMVGDEVGLTIDVELLKKSEPAAAAAAPAAAPAAPAKTAAAAPAAAPAKK